MNNKIFLIIVSTLVFNVPLYPAAVPTKQMNSINLTFDVGPEGYCYIANLKSNKIIKRVHFEGIQNHTIQLWPSKLRMGLQIAFHIDDVRDMGAENVGAPAQDPKYFAAYIDFDEPEAKLIKSISFTREEGRLHPFYKAHITTTHNKHYTTTMRHKKGEWE